MTKLVVGELYYVSDESEEAAVSRNIKEKFLGEVAKGFKIFTHTAGYDAVSWKYTIPIQQSEKNKEYKVRITALIVSDSLESATEKLIAHVKKNPESYIEEL